MPKRLPVEQSSSPYGYLCENLEALRSEFYRVSSEAQAQGTTWNVLHRLQFILGTIETLGALKSAFEVNGWNRGCE